MDSFQRSNYSIFNKTKKNLDPSRSSKKTPNIPINSNPLTNQDPAPNITTKPSKPNLNIKTPTTPEQKTEPILKTNLFGDDKKRKQQALKTILWLFGALLVAIFFFSIGYYLKSRNNNLYQPEQPSEEINIGQILYEKFGSDSEKTIAGTIRFEFWLDSDGDGEKSNWETGTGRDSVGLNIRRKGEEIPFSNLETDGEGVIKISGLDDGEFEVTYYVIPNYLDQNYNENKHFFGQKYYEILNATDNSTGLLPTKWQPLTIDPDGSVVTIGIKEYKPKKLVVTQNKQAILYDPEKDIRFSASNIWSSESLPYKFEIRDNNVFYVKDKVLYKYNPFTRGGYSEKIYDQITSTVDLFYEISPQGTAIIYGGNDGTYFQTPDDACGRTFVKYQDQPLALQTSSNLHESVSASFGSENQAVIFGRAGSEQYRHYWISCENKQLTVEKLPIISNVFNGAYVKHDRFILKGSLYYENTCDSENNSEVNEVCLTERKEENLYIYDLKEKTLEKIGGDEFRTTYFAYTSNDGKYAIIANTETDPLKILNFDNKDETKILDFDIKSYLKQYDRHGLHNGNFYYLGNDSFLVTDRYGNCSDNNDCATIKQFTINGNNINITDVMNIKDALPWKIVGEITQ